MSILVLLETLTFIKQLLVFVSCYLCTVSNTTAGPDSKLNLAAIGILTLYALISNLISMRIWVFTQINFPKKAIKIDLVGQQKAEESRYTQYNQKVIGTKFYPFAVQFSVSVLSG